jgi:predicted ATPase
MWRPRPLPVPATPFLGRELELAQIAEHLADPHCRLVTVLGPGGIGKTRLALQVAEGHQRVFADGVAYVSLAGAETAADSLPATLAVALNAPYRDSEDAHAQLLAVLRPLELLLVIDNFEHAVSEAPFLADLLAAAPQCKLLVTSRRQLDLVEEWVYELQGLPLPSGGVGGEGDDENSAVQLFVRSARRASHAFVLDSGNRAAVARICRMVGGLPLAIELAAAWVRLLSCAEIAAEITRGLDFLAANQRNLPERHRSMRAVFDYSWSLLDAHERPALSALSVLQGGFDREAAAAVAGANLLLLQALAAKSLVQRIDAGRYTLHELVRHYAHEQLATSGESPRVRDRHLAHFAALAAEARDGLYSASQRKWLDKLELEHENLRVALEWAFSAGAPPPGEGHPRHWRAQTGLSAAANIPRFWNGRGYLREGEGWLQRGLALCAACDPGVRAEALGVQGWLVNMLGDSPRARQLQLQSLTLFRACGDQRGMAEALDALGDSAWFEGAFDEARAFYGECLELRRRLGNPNAIGLALYSLGRLEVDAGRLEAAAPLLDEALALLRHIGDERGVALTLNALGRAALRRGLPLQAEPLVREALAAFAELGNRVDIPECLEELAFVADASGQSLRAARLLGAAAAMRSLTGAFTSVDARLVGDLLQRLTADPQQEEAFHDGSRFNQEQAVAYALATSNA